MQGMGLCGAWPLKPGTRRAHPAACPHVARHTQGSQPPTSLNPKPSQPQTGPRRAHPAAGPHAARHTQGSQPPTSLNP
eukprot:362101-Chlamydomonas_euryale.AAC.8